ncbi:MAG: hypothetical protein R3E48_15150 [Burkholderiaceae bacterium]
MTACLLCPGALADPDPAIEARLPAAASDAIASTPLRCASLSEYRIDPDVLPRELPHEQWLRSRFGLPATASVEAFGALGATGLMPPAGALVVRPVHLHVGLDHLVLLPPHALSLSRSQAEALVEAANRHLEPDGASLSCAGPDWWLLKGIRATEAVIRSSRVAAGRNVTAYLPEGPGARELIRIVNELQMLWHDHPGNVERERSGQLTVNGLWIEGIVDPPDTSSGLVRTVHADDPAIRGIALACAAATLEPAPQTPTECLESLARPDSIIELPFWLKASIDRDPARWRDGWRRFTDLLAPLRSRLARKVKRFDVVLTGETEIAILSWSATDRWKWWRRADLVLEREVLARPRPGLSR